MSAPQTPLGGQVAIVTGSSRGIGRAVALELAAAGARVVLAARTVQEGEHPLPGSLTETAAAIRAAGGEAYPMPVDISEEEHCIELVDAVRREVGPVGILVNNAALTYFQPVSELKPSRWLRSFAVNVHAPYWLSRLVLPDMRAARQGRIINVSSTAAVGPGRGPYATPGRGGTLYGMEKAALERFTQGLAQEVFQDGVGVAAVAPSDLVVTPGTAFHGLVTGPDDPRAEPPEYMARAVRLLATLPLDEMAGLVTYSQVLLQRCGLIATARGPEIDRPGSGYSRM